MKLIGSPFIRKEYFGKETEAAEFKNTKYFSPNPCFGINHGVTSNIGVWILNLIPALVLFLPLVCYLTKMPVDFFKKFPGEEKETSQSFSTTLFRVVLLTLGTGIVLFIITQVVNINALPCDKDSYIAKNGDIHIIRDKDGKKVKGGITNNMNKLSFGVETEEKDDAGKFKIETYEISTSDTGDAGIEHVLKNNNDVQDVLFETSDGKTKWLKFYKTKK